MKNSKMFALDWRDVAKGLAISVISAVLAWILQVVNAPGFDFATVQWDEVLRIAFSAGVAYVLKNFLSDPQGKVLGTIG